MARWILFDIIHGSQGPTISPLVIPHYISCQSNSFNIVIRLPYEFVTDRYLTHSTRQLAFTQTATVFEDLVIRCVRYAFSNIPAKVGRVFFGKYVALPFIHWRMLRHGYVRSPVHYREYHIGKVGLISRYGCDAVTNCSREISSPRALGLCINRNIVQILSFTMHTVCLEQLLPMCSHC